MRAAYVALAVLITITSAVYDVENPENSSYQKNQRPNHQRSTSFRDVSRSGLCSPAAVTAYIIVALITGSIRLTMKQDALTCAHYVRNAGIVESHFLEEKPFSLLKTWSLTKDGEEVARYVKDNFLFDQYTIQKRVGDDKYVPVGSVDKKYFAWASALDYDCQWSGGETGEIKFTFWDHRAKLTRGDETLTAQENYYNRAFSFFRNHQLTLRDPAKEITTVIVKKTLKWTNTFEICTVSAANAETQEIENNVIDMGAVGLAFQEILDDESDEDDSHESSAKEN